MVMATKQDVWGTHEYVLCSYGGWHWRNISNPNDTWGNYGSRRAAVAAARRAGYSVV
jgi:hypothetical protein